MSSENPVSSPSTSQRTASSVHGGRRPTLRSLVRSGRLRQNSLSDFHRSKSRSSPGHSSRMRARPFLVRGDFSVSGLDGSTCQTAKALFAGVAGVRLSALGIKNPGERQLQLWSAEKQLLKEGKCDEYESNPPHVERLAYRRGLRHGLSGTHAPSVMNCPRVRDACHSMTPLHDFTGSALCP